MLPSSKTIAVSLTAIFSALPLIAEDASASPNILWIVTDDQRMDSIAAFNQMTRGEDNSSLGKVMSPNVDKLTTQGTTFLNTFNQNPGCAPSRTLMHTGRYSHHTGVYGFDYYKPSSVDHWERMIPEVLAKDKNYQTVAAGKRGLRYVTEKKEPNKNPIYQIDLGYRADLLENGSIDWYNSRNWKTKEKVEYFFFPDGSKLTWSDSESTAEDRQEIIEKTDPVRHYKPGETRYDGNSILAGVNSQPGDKTRDATVLSELTKFMSNPGATYVGARGLEVTGRDLKKPLFIHCGFDFPHTPVLPPEEFRDKFKSFKYNIPSISDEEFAAFPPQIKKLYKASQSDHFTEEEKHLMISDYFAFCAYGDQLVGELAEAFIDHSEQNDQEWLILYVCGDHGWRLNDHGMVSKFGPYDIDLHNPIVVVSSNKEAFPAGKVVRDFTTFLDIAPTFYTAAGIDIKAPEFDFLDGLDLSQVASGAVAPRDYILAEPTAVIGPRAVIRTKDYKFSMRIRPGNKTDGKNVKWAINSSWKDVEPQLFDLRIDPEEKHDLASDDYYAEIMTLLREKLQTIVLGDGRVEIDWTKVDTTTAVISNFAPGANDGKLVLPELKPKQL